MSQTRQDETPPRSMRHKRILDLAESRPDASMEEIAEAVPTATVDVVEEVLEEYGDPGEVQVESSGSTDAPTPDPEALTSQQREALAMIYHRPEATQQEIADALDVSAPTISNRVNAIEDFAWEDRVAFVESFFENDPPTPARDDRSAPADGNRADVADRLDALEAQIAELADRVDELPRDRAGDGSPGAIEELRSEVASLQSRIEGTRDGRGPAVDPALVHDVVRACVTSERVDEDEELVVVKSLLAT